MASVLGSLRLDICGDYDEEKSLKHHPASLTLGINGPAQDKTAQAMIQKSMKIYMHMRLTDLRNSINCND